MGALTKNRSAIWKVIDRTHLPHQNLITLRNEEEVTKGFIGVSRGEIQRAFGSRPSPRKKRTRSEPRQYTLADLERAGDRAEPAQRRVDNDRTTNPNRGRAGLERVAAQPAHPRAGTTPAGQH